MHVHRDRGSFTYAVAGRNKSKLADLAADLNLANDVQVFEVDVTNFDELERTVQKGKIVLNAVGPYWRWGKPVVQYARLFLLSSASVDSIIAHVLDTASTMLI